MANYIKENTSKDALILINPGDFALSPIFLPALTERYYFLSDPGYAVQTGINPENRLNDISDFFKGGLVNQEFLKKNKITHLYYLKGSLPGTIDRDFTMKHNIYQTLKESKRALFLKVL